VDECKPLVLGNARNESVLNELIERGVVGLKTFMSPSGIGDFANTSPGDLAAALAVLNRHHAGAYTRSDFSST